MLVGSAGSGKTALTLEKLRQARGRVLYVTQSAFLAQSVQAIYFAHGFEADGQKPEFLSYREFVETIQVPTGRELDFAAFTGWFKRYRSAARQATGGLDAQCGNVPLVQALLERGADPLVHDHYAHRLDALYPLL